MTNVQAKALSAELEALAGRLHGYSLRMRYHGREAEADDLLAAEANTCALAERDKRIAAVEEVCDKRKLGRGDDAGVLCTTGFDGGYNAALVKVSRALKGKHDAD